MMTKQDIHSLVTACIAWLKENGYSEARIQDYLRLWNTGIRKFMEEHSINIYSTDVGERFIDSPLPFDSATYRRAVRRSVAVLSDFLVHGRVSRRIVHRTHHELTGEIGDAAKAFIASRAELRLSTLTLSEHRRVLSYFIQHLSLKAIHHVSGLNEDHVLSFLASSQNCKDKFLNTTRLFCRYLYACKLVDRNIEYVIGRDNLPKREKLPSVYEPDEIRQIEGAVDRSGLVGKRDYAMLLLATRLGFRSSDIAGLQFTNLDWDNNLIRLTQYKTKREVELPLLAAYFNSFLKMKEQMGFGLSKFQDVFKELDRFFLATGAAEPRIKREQITAWSETRINDKARTLYDKHSILRQFCHYMCHLGYECYIHRLPRQNWPPFIPYVFSHEQMERIFATSDGLTLPNRCMTSVLITIPALIRLLYSAGMRIGEVLHLKNEDVDFVRKRIQLKHTKNQMERLVPICPSLHQMYLLWDDLAIWSNIDRFMAQED